MNKLIVLIICGTLSFQLHAQNRDLALSIGPEVLTSFEHTPTFLGIGATVQAEAWVLPALGLGLNTGYYHFTSTGGADDVSFSAIPILGVVRYPLVLIEDLYGQDGIGYTFLNNVSTLESGSTVPGAFTYYFALGYVLNNHLDISIKIGRTFMSKKDDPVNVNQHNLGFKFAYRL
ncbi:MAG: hypothetical protein KA408_15415 [Flavobacteriales bacterium]|nr:hypothetical protein [Flavobacteriales bacterium]